MHTRVLISVKFIIPIIFLIAWKEAHAYIDPGTGSLIIQSIIGAIAAVSVALKLYWHKLKILLFGRKKNDEDNGAEE